MSLTEIARFVLLLPLFRMAEIYLNYAEAKAELGTLSQSDLDISLNKLRARVKMPSLDMQEANAHPDPYLCSPLTGYVNVNGTNKGVILEIRRERNIELVMESQNRYWDLMRWKEGQCISQEFSGVFIPASKMNQAYDVNGDGTTDICVYQGARPSISESLTWFDATNDYALSKTSFGNIIYFGNTPRYWNEDRDYFYPIPKDETVLTNGAIVQNPNWN